MKPRFVTLVGMISIAAAGRLMPHPWNVTPVAAMALFGGAHFREKKAAFGVPLAAMVLSDLVLGFHALAWLVYLSFGLTVAIGFWIRRRPSWTRIACGSAAASTSFFVVTNFGSWIATGLYPMSFHGLMVCYTAGIPFYRNAVFGDLLYAALFFGAFRLAERRIPALREESV